MTDKIRTEFWGHQIDALLTEIVREASICQVKKLREALMMTFVVRGKAFAGLGPVEADALIQEISEALKARLGGDGRFSGQAS
ncbi:MAG: hypothetical protein MUF16_26860 [Burkholderiaceae bacterium]|nr:hypothetical protein [Burkholderiaceae bacterium]